MITIILHSLAKKYKTSVPEPILLIALAVDIMLVVIVALELGSYLSNVLYP